MSADVDSTAPPVLNLSGPFVGRRLTLYKVVGVLGSSVAVLWILVGYGVLPPNPTADIMAFVMLPALGMPFLAFWDNPGEVRTPMQRSAEFVFLWLATSAFIECSWEASWVVLELMGDMAGTTSADHSFWGWWTTGRIDTRYLTSDQTVFALEFFSAVVGPIGLYGVYLLKAGRRVAGNWIAIFYIFAMTVTTIVYVLSEAKVGWRDFHGSWWQILIVFLLPNLPWVIAPILAIPASMREIKFWHRREALDSLNGDFDGLGSTS